jgi:hypothetical protein
MDQNKKMTMIQDGKKVRTFSKNISSERSAGMDTWMASSSLLFGRNWVIRDSLIILIDKFVDFKIQQYSI